MDRYVKKWRQENNSAFANSSSSGGAQQGQKRQIRIEDCKKVQVLECSYIAATLETLQPIREGLEASAATGDVEAQLSWLRKLACYELPYELLVDSQIGAVVRQLRNSTHPEVARLSGGIVDKLKEVVRRKARMTSGSAPNFTTISSKPSESQSSAASRQQSGGPLPKRPALRPPASSTSSTGSIPSSWKPGADGWMVRK